MDHKNLKKQEIHDIYQNELDIACFQHGMAHEDFKDLPRRTASDKVLRVSHLILLQIRIMMDINMTLHQCFIHFLIKILLVGLIKVKFGQINNQSKNCTSQLIENLENEKYAHLLKATCGVLILLIFNK